MRQADYTYHLLSQYVGEVQNLSHAGGLRKRRLEKKEKKIEIRQLKKDAKNKRKIERKSALQDRKNQQAENKAMKKQSSARYVRSQGRADKKRATGESNIILAEQGINARAQMAGSIMGGMAKVAGAVGGSIVGAKAVGALGGIGDKRGEAGSQLMGGVLGGNIFGNQQSSDWEDGYSTPDYLSAPRPNPYTTTQQDIYEDTQDTQPGDDNQLLTNQSNIMETIKKNKWYIIAAVVIIAAIWYNKKKK